MTNTLHRFGKPESQKDDFIVFTLASKGLNHEGAPEKTHTFLETALKYNPVNIGNGLIGSMYRPEEGLSFVKLYFKGRQDRLPPEKAIEAQEGTMYASAVFDNRAAMEGFLEELKELDLGLSVNVSALADEVRSACKNTSINIHSVEYSLGFHGDLSRLPDRNVLSLTTMCGHGLVSANFAQKMIERVKEARLTPEKAATYLAKFCVCGAFNTSRAARVLREVNTGN